MSNIFYIIFTKWFVKLVKIQFKKMPHFMEELLKTPRNATAFAPANPLASDSTEDTKPLTNEDNRPEEEVDEEEEADEEEEGTEELPTSIYSDDEPQHPDHVLDLDKVKAVPEAPPTQPLEEPTPEELPW